MKWVLIAIVAVSPIETGMAFDTHAGCQLKARKTTMNITPDMAWLRSRDEDGHLPPPPADVDVEKLRRNGWCREVDGGWVVTESAAWALGIGEERVRQEIEDESQ